MVQLLSCGMGVCPFIILQMEVLDRFVQQLKFSDDGNFKSAGENLDSVVSENVSTSNSC